MSRYRIAAYEDAAYEIVVGYDGPLRTFFGQVWRRHGTTDADACVVWVGDTYDAVTSVAALRTALAPYAVIPLAIQVRLAEDQATGPTPTPLQQQMEQWAKLAR